MLACAALAQIALAQIPIIGSAAPPPATPPPAGHGEYGAHRRKKPIKPIWIIEREKAALARQVIEPAPEPKPEPKTVVIDIPEVERPAEPPGPWPSLRPPLAPADTPKPQPPRRRFVHVRGLTEDDETAFSTGHIEHVPASNAPTIEALSHNDEEHDEPEARAWSQDQDDEKVIAHLAAQFFGHEPVEPSAEDRVFAKLERAIDKLTERPRKRRIVRDRHGRVSHIIEE